ncbi:MAG: hypothetical protein EP335_17060 [Alphaproteobacteria bacterium]|nr:MAG: hypothetical protein EP335_17060 [Alphaproteobacteria bacterium]
MPTDPKFQKASAAVVKDIPTVVADIQARPDYNGKPTLQQMIGTLNLFKQNLLTADAKPALSESDRQGLLDEANHDVLPSVADLVSLNVQITKMGQLSLNRTISPQMAKANNVNLTSLQHDTENLVAVLNAMAIPTPTPTPPPTPTPSPSPAPARLTGLEVSGAEKTQSGLYYQFYAPDQSVRLLAVTEPNTPAAWAGISWQGGKADFSGAANQRMVPLDTLTKPGSPVTVTASLAGKSLSAQVAVVPGLDRLLVTNATTDGSGRWTLVPNTHGMISVQAVTVPDTMAAYAFLSWTGGNTDGLNRPNFRQVNSDAVSGGALPVSAAIKVS